MLFATAEVVALHQALVAAIAHARPQHMAVSRPPGLLHNRESAISEADPINDVAALHDDLRTHQTSGIHAALAASIPEHTER